MPDRGEARPRPTARTFSAPNLPGRAGLLSAAGAAKHLLRRCRADRGLFRARPGGHAGELAVAVVRPTRRRRSPAPAGEAAAESRERNVTDPGHGPAGPLAHP